MPSWNMTPFHVCCTTYHAKGQAEGTILMVCTVLACNLSLQLTRGHVVNDPMTQRDLADPSDPMTQRDPVKFNDPSDPVKFNDPTRPSDPVLTQPSHMLID
jgi:hypothetical protein